MTHWATKLEVIIHLISNQSNIIKKFNKMQYLTKRLLKKTDLKIGKKNY